MREGSQLAESLSQAQNQMESHIENASVNDKPSIDSGAFSSTSSQMTIQIASDRAKNEIDAKKRVDATYKVTREQALLVALPRIIGSGATSARQKTLKKTHSENAFGFSKDSQKSTAEKNALAELVALRAKQESIRDFVAQCASNCDKGPWARVQRAPIEELLKACQSIASDPDIELRESERYALAQQLVTVPETYFIISDMLTGKEKHVESNLSEYFGFGGEAPLGQQSQEGMQMSAPAKEAGTLLEDVREVTGTDGGVLEGDIVEYFRQSQEHRMQESLDGDQRIIHTKLI